MKKSRELVGVKRYIQLSKYQKYLPVLLVVLLFGIIGTTMILTSKAATPTTSFEVESGSVASPASVVTDATASGGSAVKFTVATTTSSCDYPAFPNSSCTGVPSGVTLTAYTGPSSPAAGTIIDGKLITQCLDITQPGVVIRNSRIAANCNWVIDSWITTSNQASWTQVIDSDVVCTDRGNGIGERGVIVRRVEISGCENGMDLDQDGLVEDSYIHSLNEGPTGDGHGDGIQSAILQNIIIRHNTIIGRTGDLNNPGRNGTSAIIMPPNGARDTLIEYNFLAGGAATIYCPENSPVNVRVINNTFAHRPGPLGAEYFYTDGCGTGTIMSGNVTDTGQPVN